MPVFNKLLIFGLLNFIALIYLVIKLIVLGNSFSKTARLTWDLIVGDSKDHLEYDLYPAIVWVPVLRKTWWLMLLFFGVYWMTTPELSGLWGVLLLVAFHVLWYLYASITLKWRYNRTIHLNSSWGIIYREIDEHSLLIQKSLAELDLRKKNLLVLAIERNHEVIPFPKGLEIIQTGDRLVMFGDLSAYLTVFA